jgi:protein-tyrosine phosphatase
MSDDDVDDDRSTTTTATAATTTFRPTIFGSIRDFVRGDSLPKDDQTTKKNSHLLTWSNGLRQLVSKKKRRHKEDGFDLDLTYITPQLIAMGFPATGNEGIYRNNAAHVTGFLRSKHGDKVKVYNLCSERDYPKSLFDGRVSKYPFDDHNPPPMSMFLPYCQDVHQWLQSDSEHVVAVHCKAGKGRTGVMICAYLIYVGEWEDPYDSMQFYGFARTNDQKGVTIPSQRRFICYFAELCRDKYTSTSHQNTSKGSSTSNINGHEVLGVEEKESSPSSSSSSSVVAPRPEKAKRKKSMIGVDLVVLKAEMENAKEDGLASGDENESDSDDDKANKKSTVAKVVSRSATDEMLQEVCSLPVPSLSPSLPLTLHRN